MALARWQSSIVDEQGNVLPLAEITVRREGAGSPLAVLYADRDGLAPLGNPFNADANGFAFFYASGFAYRIDAVSGGDAQTLRYVPVGLAGENDALPLDISYLFNDDTADSDPGAGQFKFDNAALASVTQIFFDDADDLNADVSAWLDRFDDYGSSSDRGVVRIRANDGSAEFVGQVTGGIVAGSGYRKVSVTPLATAGTFLPGVRVGAAFSPRGVDGGVTGPGATTAAGQLAAFVNGSGASIEGASTPEGSPADPVFVGGVTQVRAATAGYLIGAGLLRTANAPVELTYAEPLVFDWVAGFNRFVTMTGNSLLSNPSGGIPGQWRTIKFVQDGTGSRVLTFGSQYVFPGASLPVLSTAAGAIDRLMIYCDSETVYEVYASGLELGAP